jgi:hypothetical protein
MPPSTPDYKALYEKLLAFRQEEEARCTNLGYEGVTDALDSLEIRILKEKASATDASSGRYLNRAVDIVTQAIAYPVEPIKKRPSHLALVVPTLATPNNPERNTE